MGGDYISVTKVVRCGAVTRIETFSYDPRSKAPIIRLDLDRYILLSTGEIKEFQHSETRSEGDSYIRLKRSMRDLRDIVNSNYRSDRATLWVTLTYAENMTDPDQLYQDHRRYWQRLKRYLNNNGYSQPEYVMAAEPQERGAWHLHVLYFFPDDTKVFIPNSDLAKLWGHGFVQVDRPKERAGQDVDNLGAYLSAYLTDMPGEKGNRLHFYPPRMRFWRASRNALRPSVEWVENAEDIKKERASLGELTHSQVKSFITPTGKELFITYDHFNTVSNKRQG